MTRAKSTFIRARGAAAEQPHHVGVRVIVEHLHHVQLLQKIFSLLLSGRGFQGLDSHCGAALPTIDVQSLTFPNLAETSFSWLE